MVTDRTSSPPEAAPFYTEHLLYMPHAYLINSLRESFPHVLHPRYTRAQVGPGAGMIMRELPGARGSIAAKEGGVAVLEEEERQTRQYLGVNRDKWALPEAAVVLACFNTLIKLRPAMLRRWANILRRTKRPAVIWLMRAPRVAEEKVRAWWQQHAPDLTGQLIFSDPVPKEQHIRRMALADLFLDTDIYGAHSTGTDALWAGLPVLAPIHMLPMAARVSGALMRAIRLPALIARSLEDYEDLAVALVCTCLEDAECMWFHYDSSAHAAQQLWHMHACMHMYRCL